MIILSPKVTKMNNYWEYKSLNLYFKNVRDCSLDENGKKYYANAKMTAPFNFVTQAQEDLIALGFLENQTDNKDGYYGRAMDWAVRRFQRRAGTLIRKNKTTGKMEEIESSEVYKGKENGVIDQPCAVEIRKWLDKKWVAPLGIFSLTALSEKGKLRSDAAAEWEEIVEVATQAGATLKGPYGDTIRNLALSSKEGTSAFSLHYCGRAIDVNQTEKRYYVVKDPSASGYWIIYCRTEKQDGSQGELYKTGALKYWDFGCEKEMPIPEGYYVCLTDIIQKSGKFTRIKAQKGWNDPKRKKRTRYNKSEWWHFSYTVDLQETFEDEIEFIGVTKEKLMKQGWNTLKMLGHKPG
jgi:hypothetical protein